MHQKSNLFYLEEITLHFLFKNALITSDRGGIKLSEEGGHYCIRGYLRGGFIFTKFVLAKISTSIYGYLTVMKTSQ